MCSQRLLKPVSELEFGLGEGGFGVVMESPWLYDVCGVVVDQEILLIVKALLSWSARQVST